MTRDQMMTIGLLAAGYAILYYTNHTVCGVVAGLHLIAAGTNLFK